MLGRDNAADHAADVILLSGDEFDFAAKADLSGIRRRIRSQCGNIPVANGGNGSCAHAIFYLLL